MTRRIASPLRIVCPLAFSVLFGVGCAAPAPTMVPHPSIALEKRDAKRRPLGANLLVQGMAFTAGGLATISITNTSPDGERHTQTVTVEPDGTFLTVFPFLCISYSKTYGDLDMLANARDNRTGRTAVASIKADGFWVCES